MLGSSWPRWRIHSAGKFQELSSALSLHKPCATGTEESILHSQASPRSAYNLNDWGTPAAFRILDLVFAFAYVGWEPRVLQWRPEKAFRLPARAETISPAAWNVIAFGCPGEVVIKLSAQHSVDGSSSRCRSESSAYSMTGISFQSSGY